MRNVITATLALAIAGLGACKGNDLGTGANTVDREYSKPAADVYKAAQKSAEATEFKMQSDRHDELGGELVALRGDGKEVRVFVESLNEKSASVSVRVEPGDRVLANMIHERIAGNLGMGTATTGWWFGGNSIVATYPADLPTCTTSARRTIESLTESPKEEEIHATWCHVDGRQKDSTPVRIRMEKLEANQTRVHFIVGSSKSDDNQAFAQKMKEEFETTTRLTRDSQ